MAQFPASLGSDLLGDKSRLGDQP